MFLNVAFKGVKGVCAWHGRLYTQPVSVLRGIFDLGSLPLMRREGSNCNHNPRSGSVTPFLTASISTGNCFYRRIGCQHTWVPWNPYMCKIQHGNIPAATNVTLDLGSPMTRLQARFDLHGWGYVQFSMTFKHHTRGGERNITP